MNTIQPLAVSVSEAGTLLGVKRTSVYKAVHRGDIKLLKIGRRSLIQTQSIRSYVDRLVDLSHLSVPAQNRALGPSGSMVRRGFDSHA